MNYDRLQGSQPKLLGFKLLIAATSLPNLVRLNKYRVNFSKFERWIMLAVCYGIRRSDSM